MLEHLVINRYWNGFGKKKGNVEGARQASWVIVHIIVQWYRKMEKEWDKIMKIREEKEKEIRVRNSCGQTEQSEQRIAT